MNKFWEICHLLFQRYKHLWILSYFFVYLTWFSYVEKTVTTHFHVIHMRIDDFIPFCEYFIVPYLFWFVYVGIAVTYAALFSKTDFLKLCGFLYTGMTVFLIISTLYPNGHFLRPNYFSDQNMFTDLCRQLYARDTATNLFPSIHVYNSLGVHFMVRTSPRLRTHKLLRFTSFLLCISIIMATMFLKQHSVFDVITALLLGSVMYRVIYIHNFEKNTEHKTNSLFHAKVGSDPKV